MFRNDVSITIQVCTYQNWNVIFFNTVYNRKYGKTLQNRKIINKKKNSRPHVACNMLGLETSMGWSPQSFVPLAE